MNKINVAFRKFEDGEVIAIFPNIYPVAKGSKAEVMSYMHMGQHGMASESLVNELENTSKAVLFPTYKRAQKEAKKLNKRMENFYSMNDNDFPMFRGKTCTKYQPVRLD